MYKILAMFSVESEMLNQSYFIIYVGEWIGFTLGQQMDAHELLLFLLNKIEEPIHGER